MVENGVSNLIFLYARNHVRKKSATDISVLCLNFSYCLIWQRSSWLPLSFSSAADICPLSCCHIDKIFFACITMSPNYFNTQMCVKKREQPSRYHIKIFILLSSCPLARACRLVYFFLYDVWFFSLLFLYTIYKNPL